MTPTAHIVSDGTRHGTHVTINGRPVPCTKITWTIDAADGHAVATIATIPGIDASVDLVGKLDRTMNNRKRRWLNRQPGCGTYMLQLLTLAIAVTALILAT